MRWEAACSPAFALILLFAIFAAPSFAQQVLPPAGDPPTATHPAATNPKMELGRAQGRAESAALGWILENSGPFKGDYYAGLLRVAYTITAAEGWWDKAAGDTLVWHEPPPGNVHLRIFVFSLDDGRPIPGLTLQATLTDSYGNEQVVPVALGWYPLLNAYGANVPLDSEGDYQLRVTVEPAAHVVADPILADRLEHAAVVDFPVVTLSQGAVAQLPLASVLNASAEAELLRPLNTALTQALTATWRSSASGEEQATGDYFVGYALGSSRLNAATLWAQSKQLFGVGHGEPATLTLFIRDARTGRLIPGLHPQAALVDSKGKQQWRGELRGELLPALYGYSAQPHIAENITYTLQLSFDAPALRRWGRASGRFAAPAKVAFPNASLTPSPKTPSTQGAPQ